MSTQDEHTTIQELKDKIVTFRDKRGWAKHHTPKNLAISIALEAGELLEHFQWDYYRKTGKQAIAEELIDVLSYCFNFADVMDIDIAQAFELKFEKITKKYPIELFNPGNDNAEDYFRVKKEYRQDGDK